MKVFVAGATGAVGRRLVPLLVDRGHEVVATTRSAAKRDALRAAGAEPVVVDGLDRRGVVSAVLGAEPDVVVHQMTALAGVTSLRNFDRAFAMTNHLRTEGTDNLVEDAALAGARRFVRRASATGTTGGPGLPPSASTSRSIPGRPRTSANRSRRSGTSSESR
jgi:nucleoside-diphosphate-sugar epimerase